MKVPLLDLAAQNEPLKNELHAAFERLLQHSKFILGTEVESFEENVKGIVSSRHAIGVSSGTDAILLALMALGIKPGDEVICPSFTFFATAGCIARLEATPVFVDSCPVCFNLDVGDVERKITSKTKAIIPVHLFGQAASMNSVMDVARRCNLAVIEDAAQALGARYRTHAIGSIGAFGAFSFFPSKNLGGFGDAGLLVTDDDELAEKARILRAHGAKPKYYNKYVGGNFRIDALQAALLNVKLSHLEKYTERRRTNATYYTEQLSKLSVSSLPFLDDGCCEGKLKAKASNDSPLLLPATVPHNFHIWNQYTLRVRGDGQRDALKKHLGVRSIGTEIYYPVPMHTQVCFQHLGVKPGSLPTACALSRECLSIPIFPELTRDQMDHVISSIAKFFGC